MLHVPDHDVDQCAGADGCVAGGAAAERRLRVHVADGEDIGAPQVFEFLEQVFERETVCTRSANVRLLVETRQGRLVPARDAQEAIREDALAVNQVTHQFLDGPLRGAKLVERLLVRERIERGVEFVNLQGEGGENILPCDGALDVIRVKGGVFVGGGKWERGCHFLVLGWDGRQSITNSAPHSAV